MLFKLFVNTWVWYKLEIVNPVSIAAVAVISSPKNDGVDAAPAAKPLPTIEPAFLSARIIVYPLCVLPLGEVVGESVT